MKPWIFWGSICTLIVVLPVVGYLVPHAGAMPATSTDFPFWPLAGLALYLADDPRL